MHDNVIRQWDQAAPYWEKHRDTIRAMFAPLTQGLIHAAEIEPGYSVLDVATGAGEPALSIAETVGLAGKVDGIDPVVGMIEAAQRAAQRHGLHNVSFEVASADQLPFPSGSFDAVVSRLGVMFFPSPLDGIREMLRVLKQNRRIAFAVWRPADRNPFHHVLADVVDRYIPPEPVAPDAPDPFRFADLGRLCDLLKDAGALGATEQILRFIIEAPFTVEDYWELRLEMSEKLRSRIMSVSEDQRGAIRQDLLAAMRPYATDRGISLPAEALIVSGTL